MDFRTYVMLCCAVPGRRSSKPCVHRPGRCPANLYRCAAWPVGCIIQSMLLKSCAARSAANRSAANGAVRISLRSWGWPDPFRAWLFWLDFVLQVQSRIRCAEGLAGAPVKSVCFEREGNRELGQVIAQNMRQEEQSAHGALPQARRSAALPCGRKAEGTKKKAGNHEKGGVSSKGQA